MSTPFFQKSRMQPRAPDAAGATYHGYEAGATSLIRTAIWIDFGFTRTILLITVIAEGNFNVDIAGDQCCNRGM